MQDQSLLQDHVCLVRSAFIKIKSRYYDNKFRNKLSFVSAKDPDYYNKRIEFIYALMQIIENALLRGEANRAFKYVICFNTVMDSLEKRLNEDCKRYFRSFPLE